MQDDSQLSLEILAELRGRKDVEGADAKELADQLVALTEAQAQAEAGDGGDGNGEDGGHEKVHRRPRKPTGRATADEHVQKVTLEIIPDEVKRLGLDAFERIGEESSTTTECRTSSLVQVTVVRPKFRAKTTDAVQAVKDARAARDMLPEEEPESWITLAIKRHARTQLRG